MIGEGMNWLNCLMSFLIHFSLTEGSVLLGGDRDQANKFLQAKERTSSMENPVSRMLSPEHPKEDLVLIDRRHCNRFELNIVPFLYYTSYCSLKHGC